MTAYVLPLAGEFLAVDNAETWVLVAFVLFAGVIFYMGAPGAIGRALDARAAEIRRQLDEARQLREEAQRKLAEFERRHQDVERQTEEIVSRAQRDAARAGEEAKASIEASVEHRIRSAEEQIAVAEAEALRAVRNEAIDAAVDATRRILRDSINASDQSKLIDDAIQKVGALAH